MAGENWHSDVSCDPEPPMGSILYMHELPPVGGDTLFASMYAAYEALSEPMKRCLEALTAMHEGEHVYRGRYGVKDEGGTSPRRSIRSSARTRSPGRKALFVNRGFTTRIVQLKRNESAAVLHCSQHIETPEFQCRFRWRVDSVAFWDNRCVAAPRDVGLLPAAPARPPRDRQGRQAVLPRVIRAPLTSAGPPPGGRSRAAARRPGRAQPTASARSGDPARRAQTSRNATW